MLKHAKIIIITIAALAGSLFLFLFFSSNGNSSEKPQLEAQSNISLPQPDISGGKSVGECLSSRRSVRRYADSPLTLKEVSKVLWAAYGITQEMDYPEFLRGGLRTAPSAGALYPLEIYLVAGEVEELQAGIYRYDSRNHSLILQESGDIRKSLCDAAGGQVFVEMAPASLVYSAVFERTVNKYGSRGRERYVCMDLGHSAQNVYLQCVSLGLGTCAVGAFIDSELKRVTGMPDEEEPLYIMPFGRLRD